MRSLHSLKRALKNKCSEIDRDARFFARGDRRKGDAARREIYIQSMHDRADKNDPNAKRWIEAYNRYSGRTGKDPAQKPRSQKAAPQAVAARLSSKTFADFIREMRNRKPGTAGKTSPAAAAVPAPANTPAAPAPAKVTEPLNEHDTAVNYFQDYYHISHEHAEKRVDSVVNYIVDRYRKGVPADQMRKRVLNVLGAMATFKDYFPNIRKVNMDPLLQLAVFGQESEFDPNCRSEGDTPEGASIGIGQLTPTEIDGSAEKGDEKTGAIKLWRTTPFYRQTHREWQWNDIYHGVWGWLMLANDNCAKLEQKLDYQPGAVDVVVANNGGWDKVVEAHYRKNGPEWYAGNLKDHENSHLYGDPDDNPGVLARYRQFCRAAGVPPKC